MKDRILNVAESTVQANGLEALSFQRLADAVGLSKASIFHHFGSREALAMALVERCRTKYGAEYSAIAAKTISASSKLGEISKRFKEGLENERLCLLGSLGCSQSTLDESLQLELKEAANAAISIFAHIFAQGREEGDLQFKGTPKDAARAFLALLQGMQQLARYSGDHASFESTMEFYLSALKN